MKLRTRTKRRDRSEDHSEREKLERIEVMININERSLKKSTCEAESGTEEGTEGC